VGRTLQEFDEAAWERVLRLNVKAVFHLTKFLLPQLLAASADDHPSRVINIGSIAGFTVSDLENYSFTASKAAVHQLTSHLAKRLAPQVTVNAIAPGVFPSRMMRGTFEVFGEQIVNDTPMRRIGRPSDIVGAAVYLASPATSFVTGVVLPVDGGASIAG
jgi:NAD(P)-dependent dehydrogenase (short-subunit alcohol dehydrogenase family)